MADREIPAERGAREGRRREGGGASPLLVYAGILLIIALIGFAL